MNTYQPYVVGAIPNIGPRMAQLISMMSYARLTTIQTVSGLSTPELDHRHDPESNSIGALLMHIAAIEFTYQVGTFEDRGLSPEETETWGAALELGDRGRDEIRGRDLDHYLDVLKTVRTETMEGLSTKDDAWLDEQRPFWGGQQANFHFMWFHVMEDELNHRGQIRWLRRRLA